VRGLINNSNFWLVKILFLLILTAPIERISAFLGLIFVVSQSKQISSLSGGSANKSAYFSSLSFFAIVPLL